MLKTLISKFLCIITVSIFENLDFSVFSASPVYKEDCHHSSAFKKHGVFGTDAPERNI